MITLPLTLFTSARFADHRTPPGHPECVERAEVMRTVAAMRLTTAGFARLTARVVAAADDACGGRIVVVTEGGYDTLALTSCLEAVVDELSRERVTVAPTPIPGDTGRADACLATVRAAQGKFWPGI